MISGSSRGSFSPICRRLMLDRRFFHHSTKIRESNQLSARFLSSSSRSSSSDLDLDVDVEEQQKQQQQQRLSFQRPLENGLEQGVFKAILVGKVGQKPVQKVLKSGRPVTLFSLGTGGIRNNRRPLDDEDPREYANRCAVQWHRVAVYPEKLGNVALKNVIPGAVVYVEGNLETKIFSDPITGLVRRIREVAVRRDGRLVFVTGDPDDKHSMEADLKGVGYY